jgi:hypothetical protein
MNARVEKCDQFCEFWRKNYKKWSSGYKYMALKDLEDKMVFSEGCGGICGIFEWQEAFTRKNMGSCEVWEFSGIFGGFWYCLEWLGPARNYFARN